MLSQHPQGIAIPRALLPRLSKDIQTTLPTEIWDALVKMIEANYAYNNTILNVYEEYPKDNFYFTLATFGTADSKGQLAEAAKADALQEKIFFEKYLERIKNDLNQQKILDDLYEDVRSSLCRIDGSFSALRKKNPHIPEYMFAQSRDPVQELYDLTKPHISQTQKDYEKYTPLIYNARTDKTDHQSGTNQYLHAILKKLSVIEGIYKADNNQLALQDIQKKKQIESGNFLVSVGAALMASAVDSNKSPDQVSELEIHRESFFYLSRLCKETDDLFLNSRKSSPTPQIPQTSPAHTTSSNNNNNANTATSTPTLIIADNATPVTKISTTAGSAEIPKVNNANLTASTTTATSQADLLVRSEKIQTHFDTLKGSKTQNNTTNTTSIAESSPTWLPSSSSSSNSNNASPAENFKYYKEKNHFNNNNNNSEKSIQSGNTPTPNLVLAQKLENKKHILEELFFNKSLKHAKIEEKDLHNIILNIGGMVDTKREAVRRQVSYSNKVGLIPNTDCEKKTAKETTFKMHYHTQNQRFCSPEILAHYKDFFHRIGIAPYQLWPDQYQQQAHLDNKTTRKYGGSSSSSSSSSFSSSQ